MCLPSFFLFIPLPSDSFYVYDLLRRIYYLISVIDYIASKDRGEFSLPEHM